MHIKWFAVWSKMFLYSFGNEMKIQNHTQSIHQGYTKDTPSILSDLFLTAYFSIS
jgi:hypothetical protein